MEEEGVLEVQNVTGKEEPAWLVSCRPKVGKIVQGGGFLGLWTRVEHRGAMGDVDTGFTKGMRSPSASGSSSDESGGSEEEARL